VRARFARVCGAGLSEGRLGCCTALSPSELICAQSASISKRNFYDAQSHAVDVPIPASFLILKIGCELDYAGAKILDRMAISQKWNSACTEKRIECSSACMIEEVKDLCD